MKKYEEKRVEIAVVGRPVGGQKMVADPGLGLVVTLGPAVVSDVVAQTNLLGLERVDSRA